MPKPPQRNKDFHPVSRTGSRVRGGKVIAVKDLLAKAGITAKAIAQHSVNQQSWQEFLGPTLPMGLSEHVVGISLQRGTLTVLADLPGWAVRLRYALEEALPRIRERDLSVQRVLVKVAER